MSQHQRCLASLIDSRSEERAQEGLAGGLRLLSLLLFLHPLLVFCANKDEQRTSLEGTRKELTKLLATKGFRIWVQAEEDTLVDKGVLVLRPWTLSALGVSGAHNRLNLVTVDQTRYVRVGNLGQRKTIQTIRLHDDYCRSEGYTYTKFFF